MNSHSGKLRIATCQFSVSADIRRNARAISRFLQRAKKSRADMVHFSECALSGYAPTDWPNLKRPDWNLLIEHTRGIMVQVKKLGLWVVLGSIHRLTEPNKPHNSLYLITPTGEIVDRYDKRFCMQPELAYYSPGDHFVTFTVNGVKCALLICFDLRFPELYRELKKQKVQCILQSFYNARQSGPSVHTHIMRQTMQAHAATNHFWVSMANSSARYAPYPSCFIRPDGVIERQLPPNRSGMMVNTVDIHKPIYDPAGIFFKDIAAGRLSNGPVLKDPRSRARKKIF
ncbi:MAG: carbon-nitrogen hydrolase family protein [Sedimentisphaerales bacterium]|nr:carbon-nitrogen hydrolase family protein [Sedimentisphaerales bacterium]